MGSAHALSASDDWTVEDCAGQPILHIPEAKKER
jgi:hypothetical protein